MAKLSIRGVSKRIAVYKLDDEDINLLQEEGFVVPKEGFNNGNDVIDSITFMGEYEEVPEGLVISSSHHIEIFLDDILVGKISMDSVDQLKHVDTGEKIDLPQIGAFSFDEYVGWIIYILSWPDALWEGEIETDRDNFDLNSLFIRANPIRDIASQKSNGEIIISEFHYGDEEIPYYCSNGPADDHFIFIHERGKKINLDWSEEDDRLRIGVNVSAHIGE